MKIRSELVRQKKKRKESWLDLESQKTLRSQTCGLTPKFELETKHIHFRGNNSKAYKNRHSQNTSGCCDAHLNWGTPEKKSLLIFFLQNFRFPCNCKIKTKGFISATSFHSRDKSRQTPTTNTLQNIRPKLRTFMLSLQTFHDQSRKKVTI